jgi:hypothetical protein
MKPPGFLLSLRGSAFPNNEWSGDTAQAASSYRWPRLFEGRVAFSEARRLNATQWGRRNHPACSYVLTAGRLSCAAV